MNTSKQLQRSARLLVLLLLALALPAGCAASEMYLTDNTLRRPIDEARRLLVLGTRIHLDAGQYQSTTELAGQSLPAILPQLDRVVSKSLVEAGVYTLLLPGQLSPKVQELLDPTAPTPRLERLPAISGELKADHIIWPEVLSYYEKEITDGPHVQSMPRPGTSIETVEVWRRSTRAELLVSVRLNIADGRLGKVIWSKDLAATDMMEVESDLDWSGPVPPRADQIKIKDQAAVTEKINRFRETLLTRVVEALLSEMLPRYDYR